MKKLAETFQLTASDLVGHLNCRHLTALERAVAEGVIAKPKVWDPLLKILSERGAAHEQDYVRHLEADGLVVVRIEGVEVTDAALAETVAAMKSGAPVIVQGALAGDNWTGRADVLRKVNLPSAFGPWSYEVIDTKLARETKAGAIIQLCLYSDLLTQMQSIAPEYMYVVAPWSDFIPQRYRYSDFSAYCRKIKRGLLDAVAAESGGGTYPDPNSHCEICRWRVRCEKQRRDDDHLCLVANISKTQIAELKTRGISTLAQLATIPVPITWKPEHGSADSYYRIREQARLQLAARESGERKFELLPIESGFGLSRLPEPSANDVFLDFEGDPFVGEHGLEYLFGYLYRADNVETYVGDWAFTREDEKKAFERFVDLVMALWQEDPGLHVYHYAPYEPAALKRLMGRYATREEEIDRMLRAGIFVDLLQVVRRSLRASVESYSIKQMEPFFGFERDMPLIEAGTALAALQAGLELGDIRELPEDAMTAVRLYNKDDCRSALALRDWLESLRSDATASGIVISRPPSGDDGASTAAIGAWQLRIGPLIDQLTSAVPADPSQRTSEQHGRWVLANILDFHRREEKALWWEYYRLRDLTADDLLEERAAISNLSFVEDLPHPPGSRARNPIHRYSFLPQETDLRGGETLYSLGGEKIGIVENIAVEDGIIDIRKAGEAASIHPHAVFGFDHVKTDVLSDSLARLAEFVVQHGLLGNGPYQAARDLLLKATPRIGSEPLPLPDEAVSDSAIRLCSYLHAGVLPIQGPPGAGKTFTGAKMICELVAQGKTVGITANSHKVIRNLLDGAIREAAEQGIALRCAHKIDELASAQLMLTFFRDNRGFLGALSNGIQVGGATAWLWSRPDAFESIDVLFVDEAAQMSLANVLAVAQSAKSIVLLGDPQQLDQPLRGTHPEGTDVSALTHILDGAHTLPPDKGLFLSQTWRLHPTITAFTSELFYDGKLRSRDGLDVQVVESPGLISGAGLRYIAVEHVDNQNCSPEEADVVHRLVTDFLKHNSTWRKLNRIEGPEFNWTEKAINLDDIVIITPYNAQVHEIQKRLPRARVGTVDKFQGQEAPIAIYSMATSSYTDAPRGMEFLYSGNRLNVATSRAKCISIIVASSRLWEAQCQTPRQVQLVNAFCRFSELAVPVFIKDRQPAFD